MHFYKVYGILRIDSDIQMYKTVIMLYNIYYSYNLKLYVLVINKYMDDIIELSEIDITPNTPTNTSKSGGGLELLMNNKVKENTNKSSNSDIELDDLNNLEQELNDLVDDTEPANPSYNSKSNFFDNNYSDEPAKMNVQFSEPPADNISIGKSTSETGDSNSKTWDGYGKFNDTPVNPDIMKEKPMSKEELLREKFKYLRKLEALEKKGVELSKKYTMESPLQEMQGEYETIMDEKEKSNSIKFQGNMLMACINGIEFLNGKFDPFDIKLDGWSEQINENLNDYDEIFGELHEKYKSKATMAPELKLLFQLGGSAMMVHMTNTMFKSAMPSMDDVLRQNPDLMRSFQSAAVNTMGQSNPGLGGFMSNMMNDNLPNSFQGPPPPMQTQGPNAQAPPANRGGNNNSGANFSYGVNNVDDGINLRENNEQINMQDKSRRSVPRNEMKGPSDITEILSGIKTKTINIQSNDNLGQTSPTNDEIAPDNSTISISDLKSLQSEGGKMPKKSRRRKQSASNTVSLDI